ncbi:NAD(P)-dependent dehydrogenase, short-chain alcohol dehydrogenase family [Singulisphaera sp. GP187]|uniref:SDR family oxidoreductase n=1 Tax=Singulisphaera sp. GP187 TaxID=1882752 RepID=UPI000929FEB8|nr:SDR family oxidoreductase [Singulisphaera sp. GP187]SIO60370.1 NAD(P)-dependent dehydrogenase, short-chain alcohol dehydrogenase family [Singulisphaera sp. GP187]
MTQSFVEQLFGLSGQVAVVIGGTGVLGGALAEGVAKAGAKVVVAGRDPEKGAARVEAIKSAGGRASFAPVDVTHRDSIAGLLDHVLTTDGQVDMVINGAGVNSASAYLEAKDEDWDRVFQSNLKAVHWGCQIFGGQMASAGGGSILNIASVSAHLPLSRVFAYSAAKAAVVNLTQNVARELAPSGVRVNALSPGFFPAEQNRKILDPARIETIMKQTPMARFGDPRELVGATLLLLSRNAGSFITGATYYVDGGFTAMRL